MVASMEVTDVYVQPGGYFVGGPGHRIRTLLGSCVSITLWHPTKQVGALSHFLLSSRGPHLPDELDAKFGDEAMCLMVRDLQRFNVRATECEGKIFGGGNMFPKHVTEGMLNVGRKNGEFARRLLHLYDISIVSESLFGEGHRQIIFEVDSGHVWARQIKPVDAVPPPPNMRIS